MRWNELRTLTRARFALDADPPTVIVEAGYGKHRRKDVLPPCHKTSAALRRYTASKRPSARASPMPADRAAVLLHHDLAKAREAWIKEAEKNPEEHERRQRSEFLKAGDTFGRLVDFHSLRLTFISNLAASGVHPKVAQTLARHSTITLTMDKYTHLALASQTHALSALPDLSLPAVAGVTKTGTEAEDVFATSLATPQPKAEAG